MFFRDPFKLVPITSIAEIADKFTRNEILTSNEIRSFIGIKPSDNPKADQLVNSNMPQPAGTPTSTSSTASTVPTEPTASNSPQPTVPPDSSAQDAIVNGVFSDLEDTINKIIAENGG
jgi:hypothetical protein